MTSTPEHDALGTVASPGTHTAPHRRPSTYATPAPSAAPPSAEEAHETPEPLRRNRSFWLFWVGETISVFGTSVTTMLISLLAVVELDASAVWIGVINAATWLPWVLIGLPTGAWVDTRTPRTVMIVADIGAAASLAGVPIAWYLGVLQVWELAVVSFAVGTANVFFRAAYPKLVATLVRKDDLAPANSYLTGSESIAQVGGPPMGGVLAAAIAPAFGVILDAVSYVASALFLAKLPRHTDPDPAPPQEPLFARIAAGWRFTFADPFLRYFTVQGALSNTGLTGFQALLVLFLVRGLGLTAPQAGVAVAVQGLGTVAGAFLAPGLARRLGSARATMLLFCGVGVGALLLPTGAPGWRTAGLLLGMFLIGLCVVCANVIRGAWRQSYVPMQIMARTNTAAQTVNFSLMPIASVAAGWTAEAVGLVPAVAVMGAIVAVVSFSCLASPLRGRRDLPEHPDDDLLAAANVPPPGWEDVR